MSGKATNSNRGYLYPHTPKEGQAAAFDYRGKFSIGERGFQLFGWTRENGLVTVSLNQDKSGSDHGSLALNEQKQGNQPDYRGKLTLEGKDWDLAAWLKGDEGMLSLSLSEPGNFVRQNSSASSAPAPAPAPAPSSQGAAGDMGDIWDGLP